MGADASDGSEVPLAKVGSLSSQSSPSEMLALLSPRVRTPSPRTIAKPATFRRYRSKSMGEWAVNMSKRISASFGLRIVAEREAQKLMQLKLDLVRECELIYGLFICPWAPYPVNISSATQHNVQSYFDRQGKLLLKKFEMFDNEVNNSHNNSDSASEESRHSARGATSHSRRVLSRQGSKTFEDAFDNPHQNNLKNLFAV